MKKLRIAQIAPLWIPIPPHTYGGTELMFYNLEEELVRRKYNVTVFASGDSKIKARLVSPIDKAIWLKKEMRNPHAPIMKMLQMVRRKFSDFDLIHNHFDFFPFPLSEIGGCPPMLTTLHRPIDEYYAEAMKSYSKIFFCALSEDHRKSMEDKGISIAGVVPNGINVKRYKFNPSVSSGGGYLLYLSRLNKEKGVLAAIEVAKATGKKLIVAGNIVGASEYSFFINELQPKLNEPNISFRGQVDFEEKVELFRNADALLFPIDRREPFGLVMIESMACGTPVIAYRRGSVPEVVENGKTGFVVDTKEEMIEAIKEIPELNRRACRRVVEEKFRLEYMADKYEKIYEKIVA